MMRDINNTQDVLTKAIPKSRKLGFKVTFMAICVPLERDAIKWAPVFRKKSRVNKVSQSVIVASALSCMRRHVLR